MHLLTLRRGGESLIRIWDIVSHWQVPITDLTDLLFWNHHHRYLSRRDKKRFDTDGNYFGDNQLIAKIRIEIQRHPIKAGIPVDAAATISHPIHYQFIQVYSRVMGWDVLFHLFSDIPFPFAPLCHRLFSHVYLDSYRALFLFYTVGGAVGRSTCFNVPLDLLYTPAEYVRTHLVG